MMNSLTNQIFFVFAKFNFVLSLMEDSSFDGNKRIEEM